MSAEGPHFGDEGGFDEVKELVQLAHNTDPDQEPFDTAAGLQDVERRALDRTGQGLTANCERIEPDQLIPTPYPPIRSDFSALGRSESSLPEDIILNALPPPVQLPENSSADQRHNHEGEQ